eukprot:scaffold37992_cov191-Amphora_coffeaeformis.AAC.2
MTRIGVNGVQLKHFERVVVNVLPHTDISYTHLPPLPETEQANNNNNTDWPFDGLPAFARVHGTATGQLNNKQRAQRKEDQLRSMLRCILALGNNSNDEPLTIVDFGGRTGHLAIPLALLKPHYTVIVVDLDETALELLHSKVEKNNVKQQQAQTQQQGQQHTPPKSDERLRQCSKIPNLYTFSGPLQEFEGKFDIGVALHLCGELTDVALLKCGLVQARALVFAPCCVGKLNRAKKNPHVWQSTGSNANIVQYPQSHLLKHHITDENDWNALARAADYGLESRTTRNAARRVAKALLETDRRMLLEEQFGYQTALTRMDPWEASPKNDILLAWRKDAGIHLQLDPYDECNADIQRTMEYLVCQPTTATSNVAIGKGQPDDGDWTEEEARGIRQILEDFVQSNEAKYIFPVGMGGRSRKLIHYIAGQMKLAHWGEGKRSSEKTVAVRKRQTVNEELRL